MVPPLEISSSKLRCLSSRVAKCSLWWLLRLSPSDSWTLGCLPAGMKVFRIDVCDDAEPEVWIGRWPLPKLDDRRDLSGVAGGVHTLTFAPRSPEEWELLAEVDETSCNWPILRSESEWPLPDEGACFRWAGDPARLWGLCDDDDDDEEEDEEESSSEETGVGVFGSDGLAG